MADAWKQDNKEQVLPLAAAAVAVAPSGEYNEATRWRSVQYLRKRRCALWCCGCCSATVVLLGLTVLILSLTVLRTKDPTLTVNGISMPRFSAAPGDFGGGSLVFVNATLLADLSLRNPNVASFRFGRSATKLYYGGETVGVAYLPEGKVGARRTSRLTATVDVLTVRVARRMNVTPEMVTSGTATVELTSFTDVSGKVSVIGVFKRKIEIAMNCSLTLTLHTFRQASVTTNRCSANVS